MNWTVDYFENENYVRVVSEGKFTVSEQLARIEEIISQKFWKPGLNLLFDNRKVDFTGISTNEIRAITANMLNIEEKIGNGKIAILMQSITDFGKGRQFEMLTDEKVSANIRIFLNENEAVRWMEI